MKKFSAILLFVLFVAGGRPVRAAGLVAGTAEEIASRLQQAIDRASEEGNYTHVQDLRLELAQHYAAAGDYGPAARQYELLLASRPSRRQRVGFFVELGKMRDAVGDYAGAIASFQDALHDDPRDWDANLLLARAYARTELNTNALEVYQRCLHLKPLAHEPYEEMAGIYQRQGFLRKAISFYQKALTLENRPEIYLALSDCYVRQGDIEHATEILQRAKAELPRADYDVRLGEIYRRRGDLKRAAAAWEEALKADAQRGDVRLDLAVAYDQLNRRMESDRLFKQLLVSYPNSPLVHYLRAWVLYSRGEPAEARREALAVQGLAPTEGVRHFNDKLLDLLEKHS